MSTDNTSPGYPDLKKQFSDALNHAYNQGLDHAIAIVKDEYEYIDNLIPGSTPDSVQIIISKIIPRIERLKTIGEEQPKTSETQAP